MACSSRNDINDINDVNDALVRKNQSYCPDYYAFLVETKKTLKTRISEHLKEREKSIINIMNNKVIGYMIYNANKISITVINTL